MHFVLAGYQIGDPYSERCNIIGLRHITRYTPSVSPFGLTAPSEREPRVLRTGERRARSKNSKFDIHFHIDISHKVDII